MSAIPRMPDLTPGQLANNGLTIGYFRQAVRSGEAGLIASPQLLVEILKNNAWRQWTDRGGEYMWGAREFQSFLESEPPRGCGITIGVARALVASDHDASVLLEEAVRPEPGNPTGRNQWSEGIHNIVMDSSPDIIPIRQSREGNSVSYAVRRLGVERPDLLDQVKAGELSAHGAMVAAGFRAKSITVDDDPAKAARRLLKHFQGERLEALIRALRGGDA
jgi:hypothetical protein